MSPADARLGFLAESGLPSPACAADTSERSPVMLKEGTIGRG